MYITRSIEETVKKTSENFKVVLITGARQVFAEVFGGGDNSYLCYFG